MFRSVRDVLVKGHIFVNTSLTEAFCIAIIEAACCGLQVVSTRLVLCISYVIYWSSHEIPGGFRVGGVPEVLPADTIILTEAKVSCLVKGLEEAIANCRNGTGMKPWEMYKKVAPLYTWPKVSLCIDLLELKS